MDTYNATAAYDGRYWSVTFDDLPKGYGGATQGRTWKEAHRMATDAVALLLDVEADSFNLVMRPAEPAMAAVVIEAEETKAAAEAAEKEAAAALAKAARTLTRSLTVRDTGAILGVSYQYVAKLAPKAS